VPVAGDDGIELQQRARLGLSCDHRILYGADAAAFLARLGELIEEPSSD
jgi:pyruvate dehydrogenase E2 component (dihydrolipoamide acetyltransferase)